MLVGNVFVSLVCHGTGMNSYWEGKKHFHYPPCHIPFSSIQFISLFPISVFLASCVTALSPAPSVESIHATLDLNSDMQCPWAPGRDGYMNSI